MQSIDLFGDLSIQQNVNNCSICTESLDNPEAVFAIRECNHLFHSNCLLEWYSTSSNQSCPLCRSTANEYIHKQSLFQSIVNFSRRKDAPKELKKMVDRCHNFKNKHSLASKELVKFEKENKNVLSQYRKLKSKRWLYRHKTFQLRRDISRLPITPVLFHQKIKSSKNDTNISNSS